MSMARPMRVEEPVALFANAASRVRKFFANDGMGQARGEIDDIVRTRAGAARQSAAFVEIGKYENGEFRRVMAGDDDILDERGAGLDEAGAQRPDADPGAGGELEVFRDPAVEEQAARRFVVIAEPQGIPELVKAFGVEGCLCQLRLPPIAGRDVGVP